MPNRYHCRIAIGFILVIAGILAASAKDLDEKTKKFLQKNGPNILRILDEAKEKDYPEIIEEAESRITELREEFLEEEKDGGKDFANKSALLEDNFIALEFELWKIEEGKSAEFRGEQKIERLLIQRVKLQNALDDEVIKQLKEEGEDSIEEAEEIREEIEWRNANIEEAARDFFEEFFEEEEEEEEEEEDWDQDAPIYEPPSDDENKEDHELSQISPDFNNQVLPVLDNYCLNCHDSETAKGDIDLESALKRRPFVRDLALWQNVAERIRSGDMPPEGKKRPDDQQALIVRAWIKKDIDAFDYSKVSEPGNVPARRLSREEYNRTIRDLIGLDLRPADQFPMDFTGSSGFSNSANTLYMHTSHLDRYISASETVIDAAMDDKEVWKKITQFGSPENNLKIFMERAFRKPVTQDEWVPIIKKYQSSIVKGKSPKESLGDALKVILISPKFLMRVEDPPLPGKDQLISHYDMASRLSFFIWSSAPDEELLLKAKKEMLQDPKVITSQIERMLKDPRSESLGRIFAGEWLSTDDVGPRIRKDPIDNPWCTESLMAAMREETALFFHSLVINNEPIKRLIDSDYTYLNEELAEFYRIRGVEGKEMRKVKIDTPQRGGIFGHASVLATTSFPHRSSPVLRGTWILSTLLGTPPPPPPPDVPEIDVDGGRRAANTLREKLQIHRKSKNCAGCHSQIDPLGFALENYSEFGRWRGGVDNRGELPNGARFRGPQGLKMALIDNRLDDLGKQLIRKMLSYALGRQLEYYDEAVVRDIASKLKGAGYPIKDMVLEIGQSYPFTKKRLPLELSQKTKS